MKKTTALPNHYQTPCVTMSDKAFLLWIKDRLVLFCKESPNCDYIERLDAIAHEVGRVEVLP